MALSTAQLSLIEQRVANDGPSPVVAYLLWFFLGLLGGHRFYLGKVGTGILLALLSISFIGLPISGLWWFIDAFLLPGIMKVKRDEIRQRMMMEFLAMGRGSQAPSAAPAPVPAPGSPPPVAFTPAEAPETIASAGGRQEQPPAQISTEA
jgi:TM2 domain-containing membrane protein YozV